MKTKLVILVAIIALTWTAESAEFEFGDDVEEMNCVDDNGIYDEDMCDEGPSTDVKPDDDVHCGCTTDYLVTAKNQRSYRRLFKKLKKLSACKFCHTIKRNVTNVLLLVSLNTNERCAKKLAKKGYMVELDVMHFISASLPSLPVKLQDRIDQVSIANGFDGATYNRNLATGVNIFILDTGVRRTHDEFETNRAEFFSDEVTPGSPVDGDVNSHGTAVASVAVGASIGVARGATLQSIRVCNAQGLATTADVIAGLDAIKTWADANPNEKCVVSYSLSTDGTSDTLDDAFEDIVDLTDCVVVVAAGNSMSNAANFSPARLSSVITVGASRFRNSRTTDDIFSSSNFGSDVDIYAPGRNINVANLAGTSDSDYSSSASGTSYATPAVAGAAAMILATTTSFSTSETMTAQVKDILLDTATDFSITAGGTTMTVKLLNVADNTYYQ